VNTPKGNAFLKKKQNHQCKTKKRHYLAVFSLIML
jgi:hypothetical protein